MPTPPALPSPLPNPVNPPPHQTNPYLTHHPASSRSTSASSAPARPACAPSPAATCPRSRSSAAAAATGPSTSTSSPSRRSRAACRAAPPPARATTKTKKTRPPTARSPPRGRGRCRRVGARPGLWGVPSVLGAVVSGGCRCGSGMCACAIDGGVVGWPTTDLYFAGLGLARRLGTGTGELLG